MMHTALETGLGIKDDIETDLKKIRSEGLGWIHEVQ
jgi:hypothetical protein